MRYIKYDAKEIEIKEIKDLEEFTEDRDGKVKWLNLVGMEDEKIKDLCEEMCLHPLVTEDILDTDQRAGLEVYPDHLFILAKYMIIDKEGRLDLEQVSFILYEDRLISIQENPNPLFNSINNRLKEGSNLRKSKVDNLLYTILDLIVGNYFKSIETLGDEIDLIEDELLESPSKEVLEKIYYIKRELITIRNFMWPMSDLMNKLSKNQSKLIRDENQSYFRDLENQIIQIIEIIESYREISSGMLDTYLSSIGNKTNDIMKILTIYTTIFTPLGFLTGLYGMNFKYMPELNWKYSYLGFWVLSIGISLAMLRFFKRKDWI